MAALLVSLSIMAIMLSAALPVWQTAVKREREAELIFRGEQYAQAISLFQRRFAGTFPPNIDVLVTQKFLRRAYKDPITGGDFQPVFVGSMTTALGTAGAAAARGATGQPVTPLGRGTPPPTPFARGAIMGVASTSTASSLPL